MIEDLQDIRLVQPKNVNQQKDVERWLPGVQVGAICDGPRNPLVWSVGQCKSTPEGVMQYTR